MHNIQHWLLANWPTEMKYMHSGLVWSGLVRVSTLASFTQSRGLRCTAECSTPSQATAVWRGASSRQVALVRCRIARILRYCMHTIRTYPIICMFVRDNMYICICLPKAINTPKRNETKQNKNASHSQHLRASYSPLVLIPSRVLHFTDS